MIDIVDIKEAVKNGLLLVEIKNGNILLKDTRTWECVKIGEIKDGEPHV